MIKHNITLALQETLNLIGGVINEPLTVNNLTSYSIVDKDEYVEKGTPTFKGDVGDGVNYMEENIDKFVLYDKFPNIAYGSRNPKVEIIFIRK